jgi:hypothetical protein
MEKAGSQHNPNAATPVNRFEKLPTKRGASSQKLGTDAGWLW